MIDLNAQDCIQRMLRSISAKKGRDVSESTIEAYFIYINRFCDFCEMNPDELIAERSIQWNSDDIFTSRKHEEKLIAFINYLREEGYSSNTIATAVGAVKSLYRCSYMPMIEVNVPSGQAERVYKIPTKEELRQAIDLAYMPWHGAFMTLTKDSGISLQDMLALKMGDGSLIYGSIADQIKKDQVPIHLNITREKTNFKYQTFLGEDSFELLNNGAIFPDLASHNKRLFPYVPTSIQAGMKNIGEYLGWKHFTPYCLRKWFRTQLTLSNMNETLIEIMMGHSIGKVKAAYLVPPPQKLMEIYENFYDALKL